MAKELDPKVYQSKIIYTDNVIQYYIYSKPMFYNFEADRENYEKQLDGIKDERSLYRARDNMLLTISANVNYYSKFLTLTTAKTTLDREQFLKYFNQFQKNFKRIFGEALKYIAVLEKQKKRGIKENNQGSWHIHLIVFNSKKLSFKQLKQAWGYYGSLDIRKCRHVSELGAYMLKYLTKDNVEINKKAIIKSHNLKSPLIYRDSGMQVPDKYNYKKSYIVYQRNPADATTPDELEKMKITCDFYEVHLNRPKTKYQEDKDIQKIYDTWNDDIKLNDRLSV